MYIQIVENYFCLNNLEDYLNKNRLPDRHPMYDTKMQLWNEVRRAVLVDGVSQTQACQEFNIHSDTLKRILAHSESPGWNRKFKSTSNNTPRFVTSTVISKSFVTVIASRAIY